MNANEAPKKIYISLRPSIFGGHIYTTVNKDFPDAVEYTRTDSFIEKACEWLKDNITYTHPRKGTEECVVNLEKFINYMEGE